MAVFLFSSVSLFVPAWWGLLCFMCSLCCLGGAEVVNGSGGVWLRCLRLFSVIPS
jgi:hypothetical protein